MSDVLRLVQRVAYLPCANQTEPCRRDHVVGCECTLAPAGACVRARYPYGMCFSCHARLVLASLSAQDGHAEPH